MHSLLTTGQLPPGGVDWAAAVPGVAGVLVAFPADSPGRVAGADQGGEHLVDQLCGRILLAVVKTCDERGEQLMSAIECATGLPGTQGSESESVGAAVRAGCTGHQPARNQPVHQPGGAWLGQTHTALQVLLAQAVYRAGQDNRGVFSRIIAAGLGIFGQEIGLLFRYGLQLTTH